jgi:hypothetical protein
VNAGLGTCVIYLHLACRLNQGEVKRCCSSGAAAGIVWIAAVQHAFICTFICAASALWVLQQVMGEKHGKTTTTTALRGSSKEGECLLHCIEWRCTLECATFAFSRLQHYFLAQCHAISHSMENF